jgi:hypothetical protein
MHMKRGFGMAIRTLMLLQGAGLKGMVRLMQENGTYTAAVMISGIPEGRDEYSVYLFYDEENFEKLGALHKGELQNTIKARGVVKAAGVIKGQEAASLIMTGETGDFDWDRAKSIFYMKNMPAPKPMPLRPVALDPVKPAGQNPIKTVAVNPIKPAAPIKPVYPAAQKAAEPPSELDRVYEEISSAPDMHITPDYDYEEPPMVPAPMEAGPIEKNSVFTLNDEEALLERARFAFEQAHQEACDQCPLHAQKTAIRPFARQYLDYEWERTEFPGLKGYWHYITGRQFVNGTLQKIAIGVPGDYALNPPSWLYGFNTYVFADDGDAKGYWLLFEDA